MADAIPILWPSDIEFEVQSPYSILATQIAALSRMTKGLLRAELSQDNTESEDGLPEVTFSLDIVAPSLRNYRHHLLRAGHAVDLPYPAWIEASCLKRARGDGVTNVVFASDPDAFINHLGAALNSREVKQVFMSLLARINDQSGRAAATDSEAPTSP